MSDISLYETILIRTLSEQEKETYLFQILAEWGIGVGKIKSGENKEASIIVKQMIKLILLQYQDFSLYEIEYATLLAQANSLVGLSPKDISLFTVPVLGKILSAYRSAHKAKVLQDTKSNSQTVPINYLELYEYAKIKHLRNFEEHDLPLLADIYKNLLIEHPSFLAEIPEIMQKAIEDEAYEMEYKQYMMSSFPTPAGKKMIQEMWDTENEFHDIIKQEALKFRLPAYKLIYDFSILKNQTHPI